MRVLVAHNLYRSNAPSGENQLVRSEIDLLRSGGIEVIELLEDSDTIPPGIRGVLRAAPGPFHSPSGVRRFKTLLERERPDVVHLHQVLPLISPAVVGVAAEHGVPVVQTVHNYRHGCANGLHLRDGQVCTDCVGSRLELPALRHGCYRDSRLQTVPVALGMVRHRRTWRRGVDRYLALTPFMRDMLVAYGLPAERISIRPTWVPDPGFAGEPGRDVLYVGRLDSPKGIDRLLDAWALARRTGLHPQQRLVIAGDGPLRGLVEAALDVDPSIVWLGQVPPERIAQAMAEASYVAVPSRVFEGYPLTVAEARGRGRAVLTVSGGSVGTIVDDETGWVVEPTATALAGALTSITPEAAATRGAHARLHYERQNTPAEGLATLRTVYAEVLARRDAGGSP